jgi:hypothetical protein
MRIDQGDPLHFERGGLVENTWASTVRLSFFQCMQEKPADNTAGERSYPLRGLWAVPPRQLSQGVDPKKEL